MIKIVNADDVGQLSVFTENGAAASIEKTVTEILADVQLNGDAAVLRYTRKFDKADLTALEVTREELDAAFEAVDPCFLEVLKKAAVNIEKYHRCQVRNGYMITGEDGVVLGQRILPLDTVGVYIPGGTAAYPSTVLMSFIPAKLAGVRQLVMMSPPSKAGTIDPSILAAARLGGADRIFKAGGAQAVAALAYGTESVPRVDKIVGPGNAFVAEAKRQVFGLVAIDMLAGPSDILVIADGTAEAEHVAADLLSQAEHDAMARSVLVTDSPELAEKVSLEIERQLETLPRRDIAGASIDNNGRIILAGSIDAAVEISNRIAPEHLELCIDNPFDYLDKVKNAGSVFLGKYCPEALGDYFAGPNHTLPTMGTARFASPLSVDDFVKKSSYTYYTPEALRKVGDDIACFARNERLEAHARSATIRFKSEG